METRKITDPRIRTLKKIEEGKESAQKKVNMLEMKRREFLETLFENPVRMTEVTKEVIQLRQKALKHEAVKSLLAHVPIEDIALVEDVGNEKYIGKVWDCPGFNSCDHIFGFINDWFLRQRYLFGSPKDSVKFIFKRSGNERYYFCGFITTFPMKAA